MKRIFLSLGFLLSLCVSGPCTEQNQSDGIRVGVSGIPPFVIFNGSEVLGVSAGLWMNIADSLNIDYTYVRFTSYIDLMDALKEGSIDFTINPVTLTDTRLENFRLTIPFYTSQLALAARPAPKIPQITVFLSLINWRTLQLVTLLFSVVLVFAILIWLAERRKNSKEFRKNHTGILDGIWWAFVTMTTVGYGDKIPKTKLGRILTLVWMLYAIALLFVFTAEISSELTVTKLQGDIDTVDELRKIKVGTLDQAGFASFCQINRIPYTPYNDLLEGLNAIKKHEIQGFMGDLSTLEYTIEKFKMGGELVITPSSLNDQYFCFAATRHHLAMVDQINPVLLNIIESVEWLEILYANGITP